MRRERSSAKEDLEGRVVVGTRVSLSMVQRRPNWEGEDTRVWNAMCSSWDAGRGVSLVLCELGSSPGFGRGGT